MDWRDLSGIRAADFSGFFSVEGSKNRFRKPRSKDQSLNYLQLSHEKKKTYYFPMNPGWLIGILIMVYYDPYIPG